MEKIKERLALLKMVKTDIEEKMSSFPAGSLESKSELGIFRYYKYLNKKLIYLSANQKEEIKFLEKKLYYTKLLDSIENEETFLAKIQDLAKKISGFESVFLNIPEEKRHLIKPYETKILLSDEEISVWKRNCWFRKNSDSENSFYTQNGEKVRSKSEVIIADRLFSFGVPYVYESSLTLQEENTSKTFAMYPDFLVLNRRTGKQYWWEHFGMLDNPEYCEMCQRKIEIFAFNGIFPGENLIITTESSKHNFNTMYADLLIKKFLL